MCSPPPAYLARSPSEAWLGRARWAQADHSPMRPRGLRSQPRAHRRARLLVALVRWPAPAAARRCRARCEADVAIVGAGYTGLWTAYYLKRARPSLRDRRARARASRASARRGATAAGSRASSRGPRAPTNGAPGRAALAALQRAMFETVEEVAAVRRASTAIDADFAQAADSSASRSAGAQAARLREELATARSTRDRRAGPARADARGARRSGSGSRARAARPSRRTWRACTPLSCCSASPARSSSWASRSTSARRCIEIRPHARR